MKRLWIILFIGILTACSQIEPFEDTRREAGQTQPIGQSLPDKPAICYNPLWHDEEEIQKRAEEICKKSNKKAVFLQNTPFSCRLATPSTAIYQCK